VRACVSINPSREIQNLLQDWLFWHLMKGHLFKTAFVKNVPLFLRNIGENVLLCLAASGIEATSKRCLKLMDLQWQQHLTGRIHTHYFQNMVRCSPLADTYATITSTI
jgi:ABC transporter transmembrane region 2